MVIEMEISERKKKILKAVIEGYIETAEPVSSKAIAADLGLSSATIRNEMADLEHLGYLEQPHTSAGRVPSHKGYRMYVNELMTRHMLSLEESSAINASLNAKMQQLDRMLEEVGQLTSRLTHYPAYALAAHRSAVTVQRFDFIYVEANTFIIVLTLSSNVAKSKLVHLPTPVEQETLVHLATVFNANFTGLTEDQITPQRISNTQRAMGDDIGLVPAVVDFVLLTLTETSETQSYLAGASHILQHPEFQDLNKAQELLNYLSDGSELLKLPPPEDGAKVKILIGPENIADALRDSSVIMASYDAGDNLRGLIGVVGPTRIDYATIAARLSYIAHGLGQILSGGGLPSTPEKPAIPEKNDDGKAQE